MTRRMVVAGAALTMIAAACASAGSDPSADAPATPAATGAPVATEPATPAATDVPVATEPATPAATDVPVATEPATPAATDAPVAADAATVEQINDYIAQAAAFDQVGADAQFPAGLAFNAGGAPGYSRYVFREHSEGVVPTLVEGPINGTVRCQDEALPCSYLELKALDESGAQIPDALDMTADELATLVAQLDELNAFAEAHRDVNSACAAEYVSDRIQTPNMGSHFYNLDAIGNGFDPGQPEILLYARADGELPGGPLGQCLNGVWVGEPLELVGTAFLVPPQIIGDDHPAAFAGPLDNWHIHFNLCRGNDQGRDTFLPKSECEAAGGNFSDALGWMLHAWVDPAHDNDLGVFSMWNSSITPQIDAATIRDTREVKGSDFPDGARQSLITDFRYTGELSVTTGQPLFFNNVDAVPHTVTAGTEDAPTLDTFDSGLLTPGSNFEVSFDEAGVYSLFCTLHPGMAATVTVTD